MIMAWAMVGWDPVQSLRLARLYFREVIHTSVTNQHPESAPQPRHKGPPTPKKTTSNNNDDDQTNKQTNMATSTATTTTTTNIIINNRTHTHDHITNN